MSRSLPDVRDGLKPVHRRLIYAMHQLKLDPASGFKKCARVVGDVMGKFHPHGDASIYDALVRLAQDFAVRYPLIEGQGNFGNIDGDNPAAMRYTEARMTEVAQALLAGIDDDAVDFRPTYDGEDHEPVVLPGGFPNLLANGAAGIAVGMATSIPPHNAGEVCAAAIHLIHNPLATVEDLLAHMPGPDFPTGGTPGRGPCRHPPGLRDRPRRLPAARQVGDRARQARHVAGRRDRNPLSGAEVEAHRADRRAAGGQEAAVPGRRARREHRTGPPCARAQGPHRRPGGADGDDVPRDPARDPLPAQHERADRRPHAHGAGPEGGAAGLARPPQPGADPPLQPPPRRHPAQARGAGRLPGGVPEPRRGDPHHPRGGPPEARAGRRLHADGRAGRGHPEHAPALAAPLGGDGDPEGAPRPGTRGARPARPAEVRHATLEAHRRRDGGHPGQVRHRATG